MEFLLIWVLGSDVIDSGLRYKNAAKCFSESQNAAAEMRNVGLTPPQFTCIPVAKDKDFKIYRKDSSSSRFPF
jgi:hypothetical protein